MSPETAFPSIEALAVAIEDIFTILSDGVGLNSGVKETAQMLQKNITRLLQKAVNKRPLGFSGASPLVEFSESLLSEWEESAPSSVAVQKLVSLLCKPSVKNLFITYDDVVQRRYTPSLPEIPFEVDDDDGLAIKIIKLIKSNEPLGATIKCDPDGSVYIARIIASGVAERSGCIQVGDRLLEVNDVSVTGMKPNEIVQLLNCESSVVMFKLLPAAISSTAEHRPKGYIRAMIDYMGNTDTLHPCPEASLSFCRGDILELIITDDEHWWQARRLGFGAFACSSDDKNAGMAKVGLIPSELLQQKRLDDVGSKNRVTKSANGVPENKDFHSYEPVSRVCFGHSVIRPIILIGAPSVGRNELKRRLILSNCERYASTVPHTSRPPRSHETDGFDYHFAKRTDMEIWIRDGRFLEYGEYKGNLYGTLTDSVVSVMQQGRVPVLNPHPLALRVLRNNRFKPFIIFVKSPELKILKETRTRALNLCDTRSASLQTISSHPRTFTDFELEQIVSTSNHLFRLYGQYADVIIVNTVLEKAFSQLSHALHLAETKSVWVPSSWTEISLLPQCQSKGAV